MRIVRTTVGTAMVLCLTLAPLDAASKGKGSAPVKVSSSKAPTSAKATPSPKTTKTVKVTKAPKAPTLAKATQSPKTTKTTAKVTKAPKVTTTAKASSTPKTKTPKTTTTSQTKLAKAETKSAKKSSTTATTTSSTTTPTTTTTTTVDFTQGKVGEKLTKNTKLAEKLGHKLTAMGYTGDVYEAAYGFKNLGQFNAAVNNAQNHDLSFEQLKTLMTGVSVDAKGVVLYANRNLDGTVTMVPLAKVTDPAPTKSLGQAKKIIGTLVVEAETTTPTTVKN
jgi:hypothetical protein